MKGHIIMLLVWATLLVTSPGVFAQVVALQGQYTHEGKNDMSSMFVFAEDGSFVAFRISDLASTYGEGRFELQGKSLILHYDSTGVSKRVSRKHLITPTQTDTLALRSVTSRKFELVLNLSGYVETYRKVNDPLLKKR